MMFDSQYTGHFASLLAAALWAVASIFFTRLQDRVHALTLNFLKTGIACLLMLVTLRVLSGSFWPARLASHELLWLASSGLIGLTIGDSLLFLAFKRIGPRRALLFMTLAPPVTALLAWPLLGEPVTLKMAAGIILTIAGVAFVIDSGSSSGEKLLGKGGYLLAAGSAICQAVGNLGTKLGGQHAPLELGIVRITAGAVGLLVLMACLRPIRHDLEPLKESKTFGYVLIATLLGTYLGIWLQVAGLRYAPAGIAATLSSTSPIFVLPLAAVWLGDSMNARSVSAALLATCGMALLFDV